MWVVTPGGTLSWMRDLLTIAVHPSQFPDRIRHAILSSLRSRQINPKLHYGSTTQTLRWLALHETLSPARAEPGCSGMYEACFDFLVERFSTAHIHVVSLGCGGGWKEALLLEKLQKTGMDCSYTPVDVSTSMVIVARQAALGAAPQCRCHPIVADLAEADDLGPIIGSLEPENTPQLITCFGLLPNFEPHVLGSRLKSLVRKGDILALSANLAPGNDYRGGVRSVLGQYDNPPTRDWLAGLLEDLGFTVSEGALAFRIEESAEALGLLRIVAELVLNRDCRIEFHSEHFEFEVGACIRTFFSYRYTPSLVRSFLRISGLDAQESWISPSGEEGAFVAAAC